jgi:phenylalanyl-tRNA synthetase beta subunit
MMINLNEFANLIAEKESGKREVDISQIKEILKIVLEELSKQWNYNPEDVIDLFRKYS